MFASIKSFITIDKDFAADFVSKTIAFREELSFTIKSRDFHNLNQTAILANLP